MSEHTPTLKIDIKKYEHFLKNSNATEEQKQELLETYWHIICEFVAMGFYVHPVQDALEDDQPPCGKHPKSGADIGIASQNTLDSIIFTKGG